MPVPPKPQTRLGQLALDIEGQLQCLASLETAKAKHAALLAQLEAERDAILAARRKDMP